MLNCVATKTHLVGLDCGHIFYILCDVYNGHTLGKSSNRSRRNFDSLVKLKTARTTPLFQAKVIV